MEEAQLCGHHLGIAWRHIVHCQVEMSGSPVIWIGQRKYAHVQIGVTVNKFGEEPWYPIDRQSFGRDELDLFSMRRGWRSAMNRPLYGDPGGLQLFDHVLSLAGEQDAVVCARHQRR